MRTRQNSCGACGQLGHTIRNCPNKLAQAKELAWRFRPNLPALRETYPSWAWKEVERILDAIESVRPLEAK